MTEQKAKTLPEIERDYLDFTRKDDDPIRIQQRRDEFNKIRWVRVSELKQKLSIIIETAKRYSKEGMDFAGYERIAEELEELLK